MRALILALLATGAFAQRPADTSVGKPPHWHQPASAPTAKGAPVLVAPKNDPDKRGRPMVIVPDHGEDLDHASMHALPVGSGAAPDGGAWLRIDVSGRYCIHNARVLEFPAGCPMLMEGNRVYRIMPHKGPLVWTPPGGKQGVVPSSLLIAPMIAPK